MHEPVFGVVLAGGKSSRMRTDKRFLIWENEFWVDKAVRIVAEALGVNQEEVFLCGDVHARKCIPDTVKELGPLGGLMSVMNSISVDSWLLVLPVDMPKLTVPLLKDLLALRSSDLSHEESAVCYDGYELPLLLRCNLRSKEILKNCIEDSHPSSRSIRVFIERVGLKMIPLMQDFTPWMLNMNTREDIVLSYEPEIRF